MNEFFHTNPETLLAKHLLGETSTEEALAVRQWLDADPANQHFYEHFRMIWQQSRSLGYDISPEKEGLEDAAWDKFRQRLHEPRAEKSAAEMKPGSLLPLLRNRSRIAALFFLAASVSGIIYLLQHPRRKQRELTFHTEEAVATNKLPDGSTITLNKQSTVSCERSFNDIDRKIHLQGEAFFQVAPDRERPFHVYTNGIAVTVLGTSFNVRDSGSRTVITVETGAIMVTNAHDSILLHGGERIVLGENDPALTKAPFPAVFYKYYHPLEFICNHTPLWQLTAALETAYHVKIGISGQAIRELPINTEFRNESLDQILSVIQETFQIRVARSGDSIILH